MKNASNQLNRIIHGRIFLCFLAVLLLTLTPITGAFAEDSADESLVSMFSFAPGSVGPQTAAAMMIDADTTLQNAVPEPSTVFKYGPFDFCVSNDEADEGVTSTGDIMDLPDSLQTSSKPISAWNDIFVDYNYFGFTMSNFSSIQSFLAWSEDYIEDETGTYACAVSAMLVPVHYLAIKQGLHQ
jgi:hypothetical protein